MEKETLIQETADLAGAMLVDRLGSMHHRVLGLMAQGVGTLEALEMVQDEISRESIRRMDKGLRKRLFEKYEAMTADERQQRWEELGAYHKRAYAGSWSDPAFWQNATPDDLRRLRDELDAEAVQ